MPKPRIASGYREPIFNNINVLQFPPLVMVDEAHACVGTHQSRQQRFELLKRLAEDRERHLILLTATPHSGDEAAFDRLLSLLDTEFAAGALDSDAGRARLARHFVQRRRI